MQAPDTVGQPLKSFMPAPLKWVSTPALGQSRASGGSTAAELFETGSSQKRRPLLETLVNGFGDHGLLNRHRS